MNFHVLSHLYSLPVYVWQFGLASLLQVSAQFNFPKSELKPNQATSLNCMNLASGYLTYKLVIYWAKWLWKLNPWFSNEGVILFTYMYDNSMIGKLNYHIMFCLW